MKLNLKVVTPDKVFFEGEVDSVIVRGVMGDLAILAKHIPLVTQLKISKAKIIIGDDQRYLAIAGGYIYVENEKTTIITDAAEWSHEINIERAQAALRRAEERINKQTEDIDIIRAEIALKKAINRIDVSNILKP